MRCTSVRGLFLLILAASAAPADSAPRQPAGGSAPVASKCVEGTPEPPSSPAGGLRPFQTARCPYGIAAVYARLIDLLRVRKGQVDIEYMERLFGLPKLHTAYDDPRVVDYTVQLEGGAGGSGWKGLLSFREGFWPMVESRPIRFQGSMRPRRIRKGERGDIHLSVSLFPLIPPRPWQGCVTLADFERRALAAGWKYSREIQMPSHGVPGPPALERGGVRLSPANGIAGDCLTEVGIDIEPDPPVPPITEAESEALRRKSARDLAADIEARWLALPAADQEDEEARNARARFMRDWIVRTREGSPPSPGDIAVGAMSLDQLRDFARRAIAPGHWWTQRDLCDQAVKEADPPAALARLAAEHKLDAATAELLLARCSIYVEGRRFKHRSLPPR